MTDFVLGVSLTMFLGIQGALLALVYSMFKLLKVLVISIINHDEFNPERKRNRN